MKRILILAAALVFVAGVATAGNYHFGTELYCTDCHVMHASLTHDYFGGTDFNPPEPPYTPEEYLLKAEGNDLCLACHNNAGAGFPDVFEDNQGMPNTNRSAGALNSTTSAFPYQPYKGHTLGSTDTAPGLADSFVPDAVDGLMCVDCHQQHGYTRGGVDVFGNHADEYDDDGDASTPDVPADLENGFFRNLYPQSFGGVSISYKLGAIDDTRDVYERLWNYKWVDVKLNEPVDTDSGFGAWCQSCHKGFHGAVGGAEIGGSGAPPSHFIRHPNATVNIGDLGGGHSSLGVFQNRKYRVRVMTNGGDWGPDNDVWPGAPANDLTPTCVSCHKAHGNQNAFGLIYASGDVDPGENGDQFDVRFLCKQCHVQGE